MADTDSESDTQIPSSDQEEGQRSSTEHKPTLRLSGGFQWNSGVVKSAEVTTSSESEAEETKVLAYFRYYFQ